MTAVPRPSPTIGCMVSVKHLTYRCSASSSDSLKSDVGRDFFVELWDVSGHERYKACRSLCYSQINATKQTSVQKSESGSSGNLVDFARHWVEKQGLLSSSEDLPLTASFPGNSAFLAAAKEARIDKEAVNKFFHLLIKRRYFADEIPAPSPWSVLPQRSVRHSSDNLSDDEISDPTTRRNGNIYDYNMHPPLPAQHNLPPPPTLYPQQLVSMSENYTYPRISRNVSSELNKRTDIDVSLLILPASYIHTSYFLSNFSG